MKTFIEKNQLNPCKDLVSSCSNSTLLIPERHMELFRKKLDENKVNVAGYLSILLKRYRFLVRNGVIPKYEFLKTGYQEKLQNLQRVDFVPVAEDWAELKCLRAFFNRSMTWIFVFLLGLDSLELYKNLPEKCASFVVPILSKVRLEVKAILSRKRHLYLRILLMTRDRAG